MKALWAPWRIEYILGPKPDECVFCLPRHRDEDRQRLVLHRAEQCFVIMNKFPYSNAHIMVTPFRHVQCMTELQDHEVQEMMLLIRSCTRILKTAFNPPGINIGLNIGEAAGAGIKEHLHFHLVPRWVGDHSFMAVMSETMVIPEHLQSTYTKLKPFFKTLTT
ncbi:HIT family protein [Desulfonatronovibrio hydrogenovorans]|uniref:HIT family protein n=1 Tax=Desulfonatronovibrio hydrogenovorans TaxID=53245 RepID=UPI00048FF801|nr:HIT domain-containing protein [Desulfonatronovibrio hydrogenovorans]